MTTDALSITSTGLPPVFRVIRHGDLPLLVSVPAGERCQVGIPLGPVAENRYMVLELPHESVLDLELGLLSLHEVVAIGEPRGLLGMDVVVKALNLARRAPTGSAALPLAHGDPWPEATP